MTYEERQKAVCQQCNSQRATECPYLIRGVNRKCTYLDDVMYGWELGQQDTIEEAVEGTVEEPGPCQWHILSDDLEGAFVVKHNLVNGDRVKLIVIKE